jgi:hypothetical protein
MPSHQRSRRCLVEDVDVDIARHQEPMGRIVWFTFITTSEVVVL